MHCHCQTTDCTVASGKICTHRWPSTSWNQRQNFHKETMCDEESGELKPAGTAEQEGCSRLKCKTEQRKEQGEIHLNKDSNRTRTLLERSRTDEERVHDKGLFEMKCQMRCGSDAVKPNGAMQVLKKNCLRQERSAEKDSDRGHLSQGKPML